MSHHKKPMSPELHQALIRHRHPTDTPSQLADSFRHGWLAREAGFKSFHRSLCKRFGYPHDEKDWWRDLVSLEEHIAAAASKFGRLPAGWRVEIDNLADGDVCAMVVNDKDGCGHAVYASNDAILAAFLVVLASTEKSEQKCITCSGHGLIGGHSGQTPDSYEEHSEPCPDCTKPERQEAKKECQACKQSGMVHCANPGECGGPWSDPIKPQQSPNLTDEELLAAYGGAGNLIGLRRVIDAYEAKKGKA